MYLIDGFVDFARAFTSYVNEISVRSYAEYSTEIGWAMLWDHRLELTHHRLARVKTHYRPLGPNDLTDLLGELPRPTAEIDDLLPRLGVE
jgi:hypothetical protein